MFIGYQNELIFLVADTKEELENSGLEFTSIEETDKVYTLYNGAYLLQEEIDKAEKERIAKLFLTAADVERGIYKAKGMDFSDIIAMLEVNPPQGLDIKALKIELKANNFYRGNPYVEAVGKILGFTTKQLDKFFETNDYKYLSNEN